MMMKPEQVYIMAAPRPAMDKAKVAANWQKIPSWPADYLMTYHGSVGCCAVGDVQQQLRNAVLKVKQIMQEA